ncbi:MAG: nucleotide sugar dehydrogenase [Nitrospira bacterium HGW-Nitrospira-1]|nr:MAG: nucleotide sugar dehydrogenase [Nitrospira bacterium HGW-Nitrospira-1]
MKKARENILSKRSARLEKLLQGINKRTVSVGVIGLGYVGLPLALEFIRAGFTVRGFDLDEKKIGLLKNGKTYIKHISAEKIVSMNKTGRFSPTTDFSKIKTTDCIIICVPTPLNEHREPDMSYVINTTETILRYLRPGHLISLESTTYPGTTDEDMRPILEKKGLKAGVDFFLAYSPEREDPNNQDFSTSTIPKVVGGYTPDCLKAADALYSQIVAQTVPVSSTRVAEAGKLLENIYRAVNIALVNELKMCFDRMDIDIWEVIHAARTKPFGFHAFYPGPGLGGHCIPIDPFYLTWKAREYDFHTKFIELAGDINTGMPYYVVEKVVDALNARGKGIKGARVLVLGLSYKKDIDDVRESPSLKLITMLQGKGAMVDYNDPYVPKTHKMRDYDLRMSSVPLTEKNLKKYDCVLISTNHSVYDYPFIVKHGKLVVDTRNATEKIRSNKIVKA